MMLSSLFALEGAAAQKFCFAFIEPSETFVTGLPTTAFVPICEVETFTFNTTVATIGCETDPIDLYVIFTCTPAPGQGSGSVFEGHEKQFANIVYTGGGVGIVGEPVIVDTEYAWLKAFKFTVLYDPNSAEPINISIPFHFAPNWFFNDKALDIGVLTANPNSIYQGTPTQNDWYDIAEGNYDPVNENTFTVLSQKIKFDAPYFPIVGKKNVSEYPEIDDYFYQLSGPGGGQALNLIHSLLLLPDNNGGAPVLTIDENKIIASPYATWRGRVIAWPGASIKVINNAALTMGTVDMFACGNQAYEGIKLTTGSLFLNDVTISQARTAINMSRGTGLFVEGGSVSLFDNFEGIYFDNTTAGAPLDGGIQILSSLKISGVSSVGSLLPYPGMPAPVGSDGAGMTLIGVPYFTDGNGFLSFSQLNYGIKATNSTIDLNGTKFTTIYYNGPGKPPPGLGHAIWTEGSGVEKLVYKKLVGSNGVNHINNTEYAVFAKNMRVELTDLRVNAVSGFKLQDCKNQLVSITGNTLNTRRTGIWSSQCLPVATGSTIAQNVLNITPSASNPAGYAMGLEESSFNPTPTASGWLVKQNLISFIENIGATDKRTGLYASQTNHSTFTDNWVTTPVGTGFRAFNGFVFNSVNQATISQNRFVPNNNQSELRSNKGFEFRNVQNIDYSCNLTRAATLGTSFSAMSQAVTVKGTKHDLTLQGLFLNNDVALGAQGVDMNTTIVPDHGNVWEQPNSPNQAFHAGVGIPGIIEASQFEVDPVENPKFKPTNNGGTVWFTEKITAAPSFMDCTYLSVPGGEPVRNELEKGIAGGTIGQYDWPGVTGVVFEKQLYARLQTDMTLRNSNPVFETFLQAKAGTTMAQLNTIEEGIKALRAEDTGLSVAKANIEALSVLLASLPPNHSAYPVKLIELSSAQSALRTQLEIIRAQKIAVATGLFTQNNLINTVQAWEIAEQQLHALTLQYFIQNTLTPTQLEALEALASACEQTHGEAVFHARAMHQIFSDQEFESACLGQRGDRSAMPVASADAYTLYPNPTTGLVYVSGAYESDQRVEIYNTIGTLTLKTNLIDGYIDLSSLSNGVYFMRTGSNQVVLKIIVQH